MAVLAEQRHLTALSLQTVAAMLLVAAVVAALALLAYGVVVGVLAWLLLLLRGTGWLVVHAIHGAWTGLRKLPARRAHLRADPASDLRVRPSS